MSAAASLSSSLRLRAPETKATKRPSAEIDGVSEESSPAAPATPLARLTRVVVCVCTLRTKTSMNWPSSSLRLSAAEANATNRPSAEIEAPPASSSPDTPAVPPARLTRTRSSFAARAGAARLTISASARSSTPFTRLPIKSLSARVRSTR
jgi:hypothetical protein